MNCYNHTDRPAVAQCSNCGKFLCKECSMNRNPILCDDCIATLQQAQQEQQQQNAYHKEMSEKHLFTIAVVFFVLNFLVYFMGMIANNNLSFTGLLSLVISSFLWAGVPYGWAKLNTLKEALNFILFLPILGWIIYFGIKVTASYCIGWFWLIQALVNKFKND